jgi:glycosyltransferase involved in cell wall biosynthesis
VKIAVDCRKIADGGIGTYLRNLLESWSKQGIPARFYLFHHPKDRDLICYPNDFAEPIPHDIPKYSISELFSFTAPLKKIGADLFFTPHYTLPYNLPCPAVVTIHDLIHLKFKSKGGLLGRAYARHFIAHACDTSRAIITDSKNTERDLAETFPRWANKVHVIYPGVDREIFKRYPPNEVEIFRSEKKLPEKFILYVGALKAHKNPGALLEIVNKLALPVVIATQDIQIYREYLIKAATEPNLLRVVSIQNDLEMALLYNAATMLVHPAFYEGFGLPPLEAMACALPVACSNAASLPEVVGEAALLFDPADLSGMIEKVNLLWRDTSLRDILSARGAERVRAFSWGEAAKSVFNIFCEVTGS